MGRRSKYPKEVRDFIAESVQGKTTKDLVELVNAELGTDFTVSKMMSFKKNHNLKSGIGSGVPAGLSTKLYPEKVKTFISERYVGTGHQTMADLLNETFGAIYTKDQIQCYYKNNKLDSGLKGYFKKGRIPFNKGMKGLNFGGKETQFKPGDMPWNYRPVGTERVSTDGYLEVKVADPKTWKAKHRIIWEEANGPIPKGHVVIFADGDRQNVALDNLLMISQRELSVLNTKGLITSDADLTKTGVIVANVMLKIGERKKEKSGNERRDQFERDEI